MTDRIHPGPGGNHAGAPSTVRPDAMPKVIVQFQGQEYTVDLKEGVSVIGRSSRCAIPVRDVNISREHCEIQLSGANAVLFDKGSKNGTKLNNSKIAASRLAAGDTISIGQTLIYYEAKPANAPAATAIGIPAPLADADAEPERDTVSKNRETSASNPAVPAVEPRATKRKAAPAAARDFVVVPQKRGGSLKGGLPVLAGIAVLVLAGLALNAFLGARSGEDADQDNLVGENYSFEFPSTEGARGWTIAGRGSSRISTDSTAARHGRQSLLLDKSGSPGDLAVDVAAFDPFPLRKAGRVEASAVVRSDGFGGWCYLKVSWMASMSGPVLFEQASPLVSKPADWQPLAGSFDVPPGASAFRFSLGAAGRAGRIWFDEVRLYLRDGQPSAVTAAFDPLAFSFHPTGAFDVETAGRRLLGGIQLALETDKEGRVTQALAQDVKVVAGESRIRVTGKLFSPADLRPVDFEIEALKGEGETHVGARCSGEGMKLVDRMLLLASLPRGARSSGLPSAGEPGTPRISVHVEDAGVAIEYRDLVNVELDGSRGLVHSVAVDAAGGEASMSFRLKSGTGALAVRGDPLAEARKAEQERQAPGEARRILFDHFKTVREPGLRDEIASEIRRLDGVEGREWNDVLALQFLASTSRRADLFATALDEVSAYQKRWPHEPQAGKALKFRREVERGAADAQSGSDEERAAKLAARAKSSLKAGRRATAEALAELVLSRFESSKAAAEAREILKALQEGLKE